MMTRWFSFVVLGVSAVCWSGEALACSCGGVFTLLSTSERVGSFPHYHLSVEDEAWVDADSRIFVRQSNRFEQLPQVYFRGALVDYDVEWLVGEGTCGSDYLAIDVSAELEEGDVLTLVSPDLVAAAQGSSEPSAIGSEIVVPIGPPREEVSTTLTLDVEWERTPPFEFSDALCDSGILSPYQGQGRAQVTVTSPDEVEYYVSASVVLPEGEVYSQVSTNHYVVEYDESVPLVVPGSRALLDLPLANSAEEAECIAVALFDHRMRAVFDEEVCPESARAERPQAFVSLDVSLATLAELPEDALRLEEDESPGDGGKGCAFSPLGDSRNFVWLLSALVATVLARRRLT